MSTFSIKTSEGTVVYAVGNACAAFETQPDGTIHFQIEANAVGKPLSDPADYGSVMPTPSAELCIPIDTLELNVGETFRFVDTIENEGCLFCWGCWEGLTEGTIEVLDAEPDRLKIRWDAMLEGVGGYEGIEIEAWFPVEQRLFRVIRMEDGSVQLNWDRLGDLE